MKVLVTGAAGMLGTDLCRALSNHFDISGSGLSASSSPNYTQSDLTISKNVSTLFSSVNPEVIFHTAAMTDVDGCESRRDEALRVNYEMTRLLTDEANKAGAKLIFFSTDYVFPGDKTGEIGENDEIKPLNFYGETKFLAENYIRRQSQDYVIFRITWLYGLHGKSFPRTILERAKTQKSFDVVHDQIGRPTYTRDVANAMRELLQKSGFEKKQKGLYHLGNDGSASWAELAAYILEKSGYDDRTVCKITSNVLNRPAKRPVNSVLNLKKIKGEWGIALRSWQNAVCDFIQEFQNQGA